MPRSSRRRIGRTRRGSSRSARVSIARPLMNNMSSTLTVRGRFSLDLSYSASFSFSSQELKPSAFSRLGAFRALFEQYHWDSIRITGLPFPTGGGPSAIAYWPGSNATTPSGWNYSYVAVLECSRQLFQGQSVPVSVLVPGSKIHNSRKWFSTNDADGVPGHIMVGGPNSTAMTAILQIDYVITFATPVADSKE